jgi:hypothetical protein
MASTPFVPSAWRIGAAGFGRRHRRVGGTPGFGFVVADIMPWHGRSVIIRAMAGSTNAKTRSQMTRHRIGLVGRLLLHVATMCILVYILFAAYGNSVGPPVAHVAVNAIGLKATVRAWLTLHSMVGVFHTVVPSVQPALLVASLFVLPSVLIESLVSVHSRERRLQLAKTAATARPAVEAAWGGVFNEVPDPRRFGGAEASLLLVTAPWDHPLDVAETQQPELVRSLLWGILGGAAALAGLGLILAGVFM